MKKQCIVSDFDGTITDRDGLYNFIQLYAKGNWQKIEEDWANGKISSKECLDKEFELVPNLSEELIDQFINKEISIDSTFVDFFKYIQDKNINFYIVSDGIDYFIERILNKYKIENINVISNHGYFLNNKFIIEYPNSNSCCKNNAGTCKCSVISNLRKEFQTIYYIGDGVSDYCVAGNADILFAKSRLADYCKQKNIKFYNYNNFKNIIDNISKLQ